MSGRVKDSRAHFDARRDRAIRSAALMGAAYGMGASKLTRFPAYELRDAYTRVAAYLDLAAIEQAYQTRIDEEGCGAIFGAILAEKARVTER